MASLSQQQSLATPVSLPRRFRTSPPPPPSPVPLLLSALAPSLGLACLCCSMVRSNAVAQSTRTGPSFLRSALGLLALRDLSFFFFVISRTSYHPGMIRGSVYLVEENRRLSARRRLMGSNRAKAGKSVAGHERVKKAWKSLQSGSVSVLRLSSFFFSFCLMVARLGLGNALCIVCCPEAVASWRRMVRDQIRWVEWEGISGEGSWTIVPLLR